MPLVQQFTGTIQRRKYAGVWCRAGARDVPAVIGSG